MAEKMMWVKWQDGAELSKSRKSPGDYSPLTRDASKQLGHVVLSDIDGDGPDSDSRYSYVDTEPSSGTSDRSSGLSDAVAEAAAEVLNDILETAIEAARPHIARWWNHKARPAIRSRAPRNKLRRADANAEANAGVLPFEEVSPEDGLRGLQAGTDARAVMTMHEVEQHLAAALVARAFSDEQVRMVLNCRVVDDEGQEVRLSVQAAPRAEVEAQVNQLLEANPFMLSGLVELFTESKHADELALPRSSSPE